jgi:hypothetical protein
VSNTYASSRTSAAIAASTSASTAPKYCVPPQYLNPATNQCVSSVQLPRPTASTAPKNSVTVTGKSYSGGPIIRESCPSGLYDPVMQECL